MPQPTSQLKSGADTRDLIRHPQRAEIFALPTAGKPPNR